MLRWKIFVPLAVCLTLLGLLGSKYWSLSASQRRIAAMEEEGLAVMESPDGITFTFAAEDDLAGLLARLDPGQVKGVLGEKDFSLEREGARAVEPDLADQVELILLEAAATGRYYSASRELRELADKWGYSGDLALWGDEVVAEVKKGDSSYIAHIEAGVKP